MFVGKLLFNIHRLIYAAVGLNTIQDQSIQHLGQLCLGRKPVHSHTIHYLLSCKVFVKSVVGLKIIVCYIVR